MSDEKMELRKVVAKGYYQPPGGGWRIFEPGEDIYVPAGFKAKWLEPSGYEKPKRTTRAKKPVEPVVEETDTDDAG